MPTLVTFQCDSSPDEAQQQDDTSLPFGWIEWFIATPGGTDRYIACPTCAVSIRQDARSIVAARKTQRALAASAAAAGVQS